MQSNSAATWEAGTLALTGPDGRYAVGPFGAGLLVFVGPEQASGWEGGRIESQLGRPVRIPGGDGVTDGKDIEGIDFKLPRSDARLAGTVIGPDGKPLGGTVVWTRPGRSGVRVVTGDDGRFGFEDLLRDRFVVHAEHAGLPPAQIADVPANTTDLRIVIQTGAALAGRVTRAAGARGSAVGPFTVWAQPAREAASAARGFDRPTGTPAHQWVHSPEAAFELRDLGPGTYDVVALTVDGDSGSLPGVTLKAGQSRRDLVIEVTSGAAVTGRLVDLDSRAPLGNLLGRASCEGRTREGRSDPQGSFRFEGIARGIPCEVKFELPGYMPLVRGFTGPVDQPQLDLGTLPVLPDRFVAQHNGRVGMTIARDESGQIVVRNAPPESAAGKAGLKSGDVLLSVDRRLVHNADVGAVVMLVGGPPGTPLAVEARTGNEPVRQVRIVRM